MCSKPRYYRSYYENSDDEQYDTGAVSDQEKPCHRGPHSPTRSRSNDSEYSSSRTSSYGSRDAMLPTKITPHASSTQQQRARSSSYFYRIPNRVVRWLCMALMSTVLVFIFSLVRMGMTSTEYLEAYRSAQGPPPPIWQTFGFLERYYGGLRTLVSAEGNQPEYPNGEGRVGMNASAAIKAVPKGYPTVFDLAVSRNSTHVEECFMDEADTIRVPRLHQYAGLPMGFADSVVGSAELLGLPNETCYDKYGRLGPYGYGYSIRRGGTGAGLEGEKAGADLVWSEQPQIDFTSIRWSSAQSRCFQKNKSRFTRQRSGVESEVSGGLKKRSEERSQTLREETQDQRNDTAADGTGLRRTAVVIRTWLGFDFTAEAILFLRSLVSELSLASGGMYTVHFLIHVKDDNLPIWADRPTHDSVLAAALPTEFHGMGTLWSERQMGLIYGGLAESFFEKLPVHGVYRSVFMPLQHFSQLHPEYDSYWNVEMDVRYTGHWGVLLERLSVWAREQPRKGLWERAARYYIPSVHGSWEDFTQMVRVRSEMLPQGPPPARSRWAAYADPDNAAASSQANTREEDPKPVWGPRSPADAPPFEGDPSPPTTYAGDKYAWGVGEDADLIALNPLFDPDGSDWRLADDVTGYNRSLPPPPRRAAVVTTSRLSRRLLDAMHRETALRRHAMFSEAWPASVALHHGFKAVSVPHPVYVDRAWPPAFLERTFNAGVDGPDTRGRKALVWGEGQMHNLKGVSWYYNSGFAPNLWRRWLGFRVDGGGGEEWENAREGRMCLPPMLLHPVKDVRLPIEGTRIKGEEGEK